MPAIARQRLSAFTRSSRSISSFRPHASRTVSRYGQASRPMAGTPSLRSASAIPAISAARFNSTTAAPADAPTPVPVDAPAAEPVDALPELADFDLTAIPEKIGYLKELGLDYGWGFSSTIEWVIEHIHIWTGLPWWASVVGTGLLIRLALLKPTFEAASTTTKLHNLKHITTPIRARQMQASYASDTLGMNKARAEMQELHAKYNIKPWKSFVPMLQIPLGFGCYRVINGMTHLPVPALTTESVAWLQDLTIADPYYILPAISSLCLYLSLKKGGETGSNAMQNSEVGKLLFYGLPSISFAFMAFFPAALQLYFVSTSMLGTVQAYLLSRPDFRKWANIAQLEKVDLAPGEEQKNPFRLLTEIMEAEKAKARAAAPPPPLEPEVKMSFIDRTIEGFKNSTRKMKEETTTKIDELRGAGPKLNEDGSLAPAPRLSEKDRKTAEDYEKRRKEEEEWKREERNHARREAHLKMLEQQREKARAAMASTNNKKLRRK
ncbi:membrane insertase OXA1 [Aspergillus saccharolyticus JOP 1030-1]|uniref:Inner membrane protein translocase n=1 Tax=Aspergillus saccharolyticus JOP 1030-1 TaxID=1450539 RepID=A0A318ZGH3_9EURO|nr:inner membrane protein translocase [Aspergillus saccharolyticus JOP 1030-1]PYH42730.1 inner membrane protein translocase [Aspergillus saccharolyticus JOP 1030-1]